MAKPPPDQRFRISCEVDVGNLGPVMVALAHVEGLTVTGSELITDVPKYKANTGYSTHHIKSEPYLEAWVADHPTFRAIEAVNHFKADGRTAGACYTALRVMSSDGRLKKLGEGMYSLPGVKALPAPKGKKTRVDKKPKKQKDVPAVEFALRTMRRTHGRMSSLTLKKHFENDGRAPTGVGPVLNRLLDEKRIKRVGEGLYEITPKKTEVKTNGAAVEVAANG
jgi:hypothetical protein